MEIKRGYTLSQFVDLCEHETDIEMSISYMNIVKYNHFLKQPLNKDMFVFTPPFLLDSEHKESPSSWSPDEIIAWQEAEKKVIFEGAIENETESIGLTKIYLNNIKIAHYWKGCNTWLCLYKTLNDLFEATKGELILKNVIL